MCADLVLEPRGSGRFQIPPGNAPRSSSAPPNALPRAPLAHPRNCIALRTTHCGTRTVVVPSSASARLEIDATVLRRNAALAVVQGPLHSAPSSTAAPMQLTVRPRSSSEQDTTASKCRRSPCCYWCGEKTYTNLAMPARAASHSAYLDALASDHENPCLNFTAGDNVVSRLF